VKKALSLLDFSRYGRIDLKEWLGTGQIHLRSAFCEGVECVCVEREREREREGGGGGAEREKRVSSRARARERDSLSPLV
jgi:hypothetical protein